MDREEFIRKMKIGQDTDWALYHQTLEAGLKAHDWTEQSLIIMEELAELSQAVSKGARGDLDRYNLIEEMADVIACFDFLQKHYKITDNELEKALTIKTKCQAKKLGLIGKDDIKPESSESLNTTMAKCYGTKTPEAPGDLKHVIRDLKFNVGDEVITVDGTKGHVVDICKCSECEKRGFYEIYWKTDDGDDDYYITVYEAQNGFKGYHKIGIYWFHELEKKEPAFEYPSNESMIKSIRIFCASHALCSDCPLASVFCRGHNNNLSYRLMHESVSTKDVRLMYDAVLKSKEKGGNAC